LSAPPSAKADRGFGDVLYQVGVRLSFIAIREGRWRRRRGGNGSATARLELSAS
jgi:hypothetical protein